MLLNDDHGQFISRESEYDAAGSLAYSAKFISEGVRWRLDGRSSKLTAGNWYEARVSIPDVPELRELNNASHFERAKEVLLENLKIEEVVKDKHLKQFEKAEDKLREYLFAFSRNPERRCLAGIRQNVIRDRFILTKDCAERIIADQTIYRRLKNAIVSFVSKQHLLQRRNLLMKEKENFSAFPYNLHPFLSHVISKSCEEYRCQLLRKCPAQLEKPIEDADEQVLLNVTLEDLELFRDVGELLAGTQFIEVLPDIILKYWSAVSGLRTWSPTTSSAYRILLKSLLWTEHYTRSLLECEEVITYKDEWKLKSEAVSQPLQPVVQELKLLVDLANYYEPGKSTVARNFPYEDELLPTPAGSILHTYVHVSRTTHLNVTDMLEEVNSLAGSEFKESFHQFVAPVLSSMAALMQKDATVLKKCACNPDLLEVASGYWRTRHSFHVKLVEKLPGNYWRSKAAEVMDIFLQITINLFDTANRRDYALLPRVFDELLFILSELQFDWYLSDVPEGFEAGTIVGHIVQQPDKFVEKYRELFPTKAVPDHSEVLRLKKFLSYVQILTSNETWNRRQSVVKYAILLVATIRKLLVHLYGANCSVEKHHSISTEPLRLAVEDVVINNTLSLADFKTKLQRLGKSIIFVPHLEAYPSNAYLSLISYYADQIKKHTVPSVIGEMVEFQCNPEFRLPCIPAFWAERAWQDCFNLCTYPSPSGDQYCKLLQLLRFKIHPNKCAMHLLDSLPDQVKPVVLGLLAAVLGHSGPNAPNVYIVYPNEYLRDRHKNQLNELFAKFGIGSKVFLQTYEETLVQCWNPLRSEAKSYVSQQESLEYVNVPVCRNSEPITPDNSVLLIDEVDDFFSGKYIHVPLQGHILVPGLEFVQQKIWELVAQQDGELTNQAIVEHINTFVDGSTQLRWFLDDTKERQYFGPGTVVTHKKLLQKHLKMMIGAAKKVYKLPEHWFQIKDDGMITAPPGFEPAVYWETFAYFKVKKQNFEQRVLHGYNYGFLILRTGTLSYLNFLRNFRFAIGISCGDNDLINRNQVSMETVYNMKIAYPITSYGICQPLRYNKFNPAKSFICTQTESEWRETIKDRLSTIINGKRSAIVFFKDDEQMAQFAQGDFCRIARYTDRSCLNEVGVPSSVTLTTEDMARGLYYQSSVTVEKNGGVHVIQCFFSENSRDEEQIQLCTARNSYRGTYEMIVCYNHVEKTFKSCKTKIPLNAITYNELNNSRKTLLEPQLSKLVMANIYHEVTELYYWLWRAIQGDLD